MPKILSLLALLTVAACGGGGDSSSEPVTLLDQTVTASGQPNGAPGQSVWLVGVDGPQITVDRAATVNVCAEGEWVQSLTADTQILADISMQAPVPQTAGGTLVLSASAPALSIPFGKCDSYTTTGPSTRETRILFNIRTGIGPSGVLTGYTATVRWRATATY